MRNVDLRGGTLSLSGSFLSKVLNWPIRAIWLLFRALLIAWGQFGHLLFQSAVCEPSNSCTINIIRYANAAGRAGRFDIRHLLNGLIDSYLYHSGRVDTTLPFDELRRRSRVNEAAQAADDAPDFSERIRASLPTITR
jgi:hypothetical protein